MIPRGALTFTLLFVKGLVESICNSCDKRYILDVQGPEIWSFSVGGMVGSVSITIYGILFLFSLLIAFCIFALLVTIVLMPLEVDSF